MSNGGYWDKLGGLYEDLWGLKQLLEMIRPESDILTLEREAAGPDEVGTDLWVNRQNGSREFHQCKRSKEGRSSWTMGDLNREEIFTTLKFQIDRDPSRHRYRFVSGTPASDFDSLLREARDSKDVESFWAHQVYPNKRLLNLFSLFCKYTTLDWSQLRGREQAYDLLRKSKFIFF